ncbi:MAG: Pvc16 family protein, partial [Arenibacter sp.]|nr:Pvc16 family protein [Arenibacter sp.]
MIHSTLKLLTRSINDYLKIKNNLDEEKVFLTHVSGEAGIAIPDKSLGLSLVNIEEEKVFKEQNATFINADGTVEYRNPELKLNLYILISANFQNQ